MTTDEAPCVYLEWDSAFWARRVARALIEPDRPELVDRIDFWCAEHSIDVVYCLAQSAPAWLALGQSGFGLVDVRVTLNRAAAAHETSVREVMPSDVETLSAIARSAHVATRFYADPGFPVDRCDDLYATWIERSCEGWADAVLVAELDGEPVGYVTIHRPNPSDASIGLIGVSPRARRRGFGKALVDGAAHWARAHDCDSISVATQGRNINAQRLFQGCGFRTCDIAVWFHNWYS